MTDGEEARRRLVEAGDRLAAAEAERQAAMADLREAVQSADGVLPVSRIAELGRVSRPTVYKLLDRPAG